MCARGRLYFANLFAVADAELNLRSDKSTFKGRIKIHLSLTSKGSLIADEAQRWALVLSRQTNTPGGGSTNGIDDALAISVPTVVSPDIASQSIVNVLDKLDHFMRIADEVAKVFFPPRKYK